MEEMKQQTIETGVCTLLLVELPEGVAISGISLGVGVADYAIQYDNGTFEPFLPDGNWLLIGRLPEFTEEQCSKLIYHDEDFKSYEYYIDTVPFMFDNPLIALQSLLEANGVVFENPISNDDRLRFTEWLEYQRNLWNRNRTYIFKQLK